jgi:hypothetical protein
MMHSVPAYIPTIPRNCSGRNIETRSEKLREEIEVHRNGHLYCEFFGANMSYEVLTVRGRLTSHTNRFTKISQVCFHV